MNNNKNTSLQTLNFFEPSNYIVALLFLINLVAKHFFFYTFPYANTVITIGFTYFLFQKIYIILETKADILELKRMSIDLLALVVAIIFNQYIIIFQLYLIVRQGVLLLDKIFSSKPAISFLPDSNVIQQKSF